MTQLQTYQTVWVRSRLHTNVSSYVCCQIPMFIFYFSEHVSRLVMVDCIKPISRPLGLVVKRTRQAVDDLMIIEKKLQNGSALTYKHDEAVSRHMEGKDDHSDHLDFRFYHLLFQGINFTHLINKSVNIFISLRLKFQCNFWSTVTFASACQDSSFHIRIRWHLFCSKVSMYKSTVMFEYKIATKYESGEV